MSVSIVLADDQPLLRRGFRMILEAEPDLTVVGEAGNGEAAGRQRADGGQRGHGIDGMRERAALHGGTLRAGPDPDAPEGWLVEATLVEATRVEATLGGP